MNRRFWHYQKANIGSIRKATSKFSWETHFAKNDFRAILTESVNRIC